ncbi:MAG TPA: xylulokinase [Thermomicrobiales bacterium]|nr:xylulokinase [Thermomicrobiales bacterium]
MTDLYLGLDLGTSAVKALAVDETGRVHAAGSAEYPVHHPQPGWAEQDPVMWWTATIAAARQALGWLGSDARIAGIGVSGQMHGTVLLDERERPLAPAIIWADGRSQPQVERITRTVGRERLIDIAGSPIAAGFQAATIAWLKEERSSLWWRTRRVLLPKDELRRRLTGELATDPGDASGTLLLDVRWRDWSPDLLAAVGVEPAKLPPVRPAASIAGALRPDAAAELGLPPGVPVAVGSGDAPSGLLGAGIVEPSTMLLSLSTGAQAMIPALGVHPDPLGRSHTFCSALEPGPGHPGWHQMGATLAAGMALRWLRDEMFGLAGADAYERMTGWAAASPPGARGVLFLPYLAGERTPHLDARARGAFLGLGAHHDRGDLVRAVMEGVTFACHDAFTVLEEGGAAPERIVLAGGGARSPLWRQIVADVFGLPVVALATADQAAMGAVILAIAAVTGRDPVETARAWAAYGPPLMPDRDRHARYRDLSAIFRDAYGQTIDLSHKLAAFGEAPRRVLTTERHHR